MKTHLLTFILICLNTFAAWGAEKPVVELYEGNGLDRLGILAYVDAFPENVVNGEIIATIPVPPEGIYSYISPQGPGNPRLQNNLGSTVDLVLNYRHLYILIDGVPGDVTIDIPVRKWMSLWGLYSSSYSSTYYINCYYTVVVHVQ